MLKEYAKLLIQVGLAVKPNQIVIIHAPVEVYPFVQILSKEAFACGAKDVLVRYQDEIVTHDRYLHANTLDKVPSYEADFYNQTSEAGACYLHLVGSNPDLMKDVDMHKVSRYKKSFRLATKPYRNRLDFMECQWCIGAVATKAWSKKIYGKEDTDRLWNDIFRICYVDTDVVSTWKQRQAQFQKRVDWINSLDIESLHYTNGLGTDLTVQLPENYRFAGGNSTLVDGTSYFPNLPTEEIFGAPLKTGVNGKLVASMPLSYQGTLIEDFWFVFRDGKVVDYDAKKGKSALDSIVSSDEGSSYLGEVALVPYDSPISKLHQTFYETLIDENASCHFALGQSYPECVEHGLKMQEDQLLAAGLNQSSVHVDFMVGTKDLSIVAKTKKQEEVPIFVDGCFALFD